MKYYWASFPISTKAIIQNGLALGGAQTRGQEEAAEY